MKRKQPKKDEAENAKANAVGTVVEAGAEGEGSAMVEAGLMAKHSQPFVHSQCESDIKVGYIVVTMAQQIRKRTIASKPPLMQCWHSITR